MTDSSAPSPNPSILTSRRERLNLAIPDVANRLLLSQLQVRGLEAGDVKAFYNEAFYNQALQRYRVLLDIPEALADPVAPSTSPVAEPEITRSAPQPETVPLPSPAATSASVPDPIAPASASASKPDRPSDEGPARPQAASALPTLLVLAVLGGGIYAITQGGDLVEALKQLVTAAPPPAAPAPASSTPSESVAEDSGSPVAADSGATPSGTTDAGSGSPSTALNPPPPAAPPTPAAATPLPAPTAISADAPAATPIPPATSYRLAANSLCWVFARDSGGKETEVTLRAGQGLTLPPDLTFLAIGDIDAVTVEHAGSAIDLTPFSKDGKVARLKQSDLKTLRSPEGFR